MTLVAIFSGILFVFWHGATNFPYSTPHSVLSCNAVVITVKFHLYHCVFLPSGIWNKEWQSWTWQPDVSQAECEEKPGLWAPLHHRAYTGGQTCVCKHTHRHTALDLLVVRLSYIYHSPSLPVEFAYQTIKPRLLSFSLHLPLIPSLSVFLPVPGHSILFQLSLSLFVSQTVKERCCWKFNSLSLSPLPSFFSILLTYRQTDIWATSFIHLSLALLLGSMANENNSMI